MIRTKNGLKKLEKAKGSRFSPRASRNQHIPANTLVLTQ